MHPDSFESALHNHLYLAVEAAVAAMFDITLDELHSNKRGFNLRVARATRDCYLRLGLKWSWRTIKDASGRYRSSIITHYGMQAYVDKSLFPQITEQCKRSLTN